jgi:hypothetical protein
MMALHFEGEHIAATMPTPRPRLAGDGTRSTRSERAGYDPGRPPWSAPNGRDLLASVAILFVLLAVLVVLSKDGEPIQYRTGAAQPLSTAGLVSVTMGAAPDWAEVPVATSVVELGPGLAQPVADGIAAARDRIERCIAVERRRSPGADGARGRSAEGAELVLQLAPRAGAVHVVGVEERTPGRSELLADCARRHLDGDAFPSSSAVPGRRYRLLVSLR